ncbi:protein adenylyltransferase SelO, mitochondrial-like [Haliotis rufescens]|uniref:protein adenylyltransferase SelO, mitochondrial-like n=1 Tax=Haliotis rufescens TaxID=6454 RepID=UPI00201F740B|nr:protein adenylyltransferase SelO, mitochondrial-like [Haliotis rufescens]
MTGERVRTAHVELCFMPKLHHALWYCVLLVCIQCDVCNKRTYIEYYLQQSNVCLRNSSSVRSNSKIIDKLISSFQAWDFAPRQILHETFPIDPEKRNFVRQVKNVLFSVVKPVSFRTETKLVAISDDAMRDILDLDPDIATETQFRDFVSGAYLHPGATPLSHRYGGHQFGNWADQLGDGRAVMLGEYVNRGGERWELQLKGSGLTPYSRRGDGRAVLRSSVREFLCSEAMHYLGIPTSRAVALVVSDDPVTRDQFYDGHPQTERGAIVLRVARTWFRFGSLELLAHKGETDLLEQLADFVIRSYFPSVDSAGGDKYLAFYSEVVTATADMIAKWQSVGFAHGVCNTDNFSLLSITIDYGPFGFLDEYNPKFIPNTSDDEGMYSFERQPDVGMFNLNKLREALQPLLSDKQKADMLVVYNGYADVYKNKFMEIFRKKLGLISFDIDDEQLVAVLLKMMEDTKSDFTMTFRQLGEISLFDLENSNIDGKYWALRTLQKHDWFSRWVQIYAERTKTTNISEIKRQTLMNSNNPRYVLRNWMAQNAISLADKNSFEEVQKVLRVLRNPFTLQQEAEQSGFADLPPYWASSLKVSCSS